MTETNNLTFIRTLLATGVVAFHTLSWVKVYFIQFPWVPAFIAISGYLITASMERSRGYGHFAWKRLLRIGPAFFLSLGLVSVLGGSMQNALIDWVSKLVGISSGAFSGNPPLWSLSIEEVLYFSLAVLFAMGVYKRRTLTVGILLALYIGGLSLKPLFPSLQGVLIMVSVCFIGGSLLYVVRDSIKWTFTGGMFCLVAAVWVRNAEQSEIVYTSIIGLPLAYGLIYFAFHSRPIFASYKQRVGDPSLGIYVYHFPIMNWFVTHGVNDAKLFGVTFLATFVLALISWHVIEKKVLRMKDVWKRREVKLA